MSSFVLESSLSILLLIMTLRSSLVAQLIKNLPATLETWVRSLGWEESPGEGNGNPLQYSDLENSMDSPRGRKESGTTGETFN